MFSIVVTTSTNYTKNFPNFHINNVFLIGILCTFTEIFGNPNFSELFKRIVNRFRKVGCTLRQYATDNKVLVNIGLLSLVIVLISYTELLLL